MTIMGGTQVKTKRTNKVKNYYKYSELSKTAKAQARSEYLAGYIEAAEFAGESWEPPEDHEIEQILAIDTLEEARYTKGGAYVGNIGELQ